MNIDELKEIYEVNNEIEFLNIKYNKTEDNKWK